MSLPEPRTLIFDFDGTIVDSLALAIEVLEELAERYGYRTLTANEVRKLSSMEALRRAGVGFFGVPLFTSRARRYGRRKADRAEPIEGIELVLSQLHERGFEMVILTSNSHDIVCDFLRKHEMLELFSEIIGGVGLFGKHRRMKSLIKKRGLRAEQCVYIGDETRDLVAARKVGIPFVGVSWGLQAREVLLGAGAERVVERPRDLIRSID